MPVSEDASGGKGVRDRRDACTGGNAVLGSANSVGDIWI